MPADRVGEVSAPELPWKSAYAVRRQVDDGYLVVVDVCVRPLPPCLRDEPQVLLDACCFRTGTGADPKLKLALLPDPGIHQRGDSLPDGAVSLRGEVLLHPQLGVQASEQLRHGHPCVHSEVLPTASS